MRQWLLPLVAVAALAALFVWMRPTPLAVTAPVPVAAATAVAQPEAPAPAVSPVAAAQTFELVVQNKALVSGPQVISVLQGTSVTLRITVDHHDELHLHGYDLTLNLPTGQPAALSFVADQSGRFEYELHHSHVDLGVLEVQPR